MAKTLDRYRAKRDFSKTPEPGAEAGSTGGASFVVQKHDATRLHYDFRLELHGVMKSWAVTRGPSLDPGEKRLAVQTEDHPIAYNRFEGVIPKGQYGGGTVMIWDRGTWTPQGDVEKAFKKGHVEFMLDGERLKGRWHLVRMRRREREKNDNWLLIKSDDEFADPGSDERVLETYTTSVVSGRDLDAIATNRDRVWNSDRGNGGGGEVEDPEAPPAKRGRANAKTATKKPPARKAKRGAAGAAPLPDFLPPQLAMLVDRPKAGNDWLHEIKFDGYRLQARLDDGEVRLLTRNGLDWTHRFPDIAAAVAALPAKSALIDGEAVVEDENGVSSFTALQQDLGGRGGKKISASSLLYAFDLMHLDGEDLTQIPLIARKERLADLIGSEQRERLRFSAHVVSSGEAMARNACEMGLEGIISKRTDRPYRSGRSDDWVKVKCTGREEFVIAGFVPSKSAPRAIGSLVVGYWRGDELVHAGRVGTGYTNEIARNLWRELNDRKAKASPFAAALPASARRGVVWVEPDLVAEVEFRGWTGDAMLRHAAYKGLREDKPAREVVREMPKEEKANAEPKPAPAKAAKAGETVIADVRLTHPDRVLWAEQGLTKQGLAEFYVGIADWILPHVVDRPLSLVRCPSGSEKQCFFQKHAWAGLHESVRQVTVPGDDQKMLAIDDLSGLVSLVQAGVLEIHPWGATAQTPDLADRIIFDLDPGEGTGWTDVVAGAIEIRHRLAQLDLVSFLKTSGGKGLHVVVPITADTGWDDVKAFAAAFARQMEADDPDRYIATMTKSRRKGRIFVDYLRNGRGATAVAAYSTRARKGATVSVPIHWDEAGPEIRGDHFTVENLPDRLAGLKRDPWADFFKIEQSIAPILAPAGRTSKRKRG